MRLVAETFVLIVHLIMHGDATMGTYAIYFGMYANTGVSISVRTWRVEFHQLYLASRLPVYMQMDKKGLALSKAISASMGIRASHNMVGSRLFHCHEGAQNIEKIRGA
jgi:hypothetical protein